LIMSWALAVMAVISLVFGALSGNMDAVSGASISGAKSAVELMLNIGGTVCLWSGIMEIMNRSGLSEKIAKLLRPLIRLLFGDYGKDGDACRYISQNMAANLLGLGSAATPSGLKAAKRLLTLSKEKKQKPHTVFLLIVLNTASIQLLPTTVAAVRAGAGCTSPYDILPSVWLASGVSVAVGIISAKILSGVWRV